MRDCLLTVPRTPYDKKARARKRVAKERQLLGSADGTPRPTKLEETSPPFKPNCSLESPPWLHATSAMQHTLGGTSRLEQGTIDLRYMKTLPPDPAHLDSKHCSEIKSFISSELRLRGCDNMNQPSIARLQVFEEAMDRFLLRCHIFRPFLEVYRLEQARLREAYAARVAEMPSLRAQVDTAQALMSTKIEEERALASAKVSELQKQIESLKAELGTSSNRTTEMQARLAEVEQVCDKTVADANEIRRTSNVLMSALNRVEAERVKWAQQENSLKSEIMHLRSSLDKSLNEKERLLEQNHELEASRQEDLEKLTLEMERNMNEMKQELDVTRSALRGLQFKFRALVSSTAATMHRNKQAKDVSGQESSTRENDNASIEDNVLEAVFSVVNGADNLFAESHSLQQEQQRQHSSAISSPKSDTAEEEKVESGKESSPLEATNSGEATYVPSADFFTGLGIDETVPMYLRFEGRLKNWAISKRETEKMINEIWSAKENSDQNQSKDEHLSIYLYQYFIDRFKSHVLAIEWGYNLLDGLKRYVFDSDCSLFLNILDGILPESIRADQLSMLVDVFRALEKEDKSQNQGKVTGSLSVTAFMSALKKLLHTKPDVSFLRLQRQLQVEVQDTTSRLVNYRDLLESDDQGNQSDFCEMLRDQHVEEILAFRTEISNAIRDAYAQFNEINETGEEHESMPLGNYRDAILQIDPDKPRAEVNKFLATGAACDPKDVLDLERSNHGCVPDVFLKNLSTVLLKRSSSVARDVPTS